MANRFTSMTKAELVEHVARAIWQCEGNQWAWETESHDHREWMLDLARAAIAAYEEAHKTEPYFVPPRMKLGKQE